ncbi:MAG: hypothetical protein ISR00_01450 [Flavobacteriales bacterium]|nr:hypothetical protein [Flavobacteriales bacterium]MBL6872598.1 hypothetical protein [Flavobacteriales bacterium]
MKKPILSLIAFLTTLVIVQAEETYTFDCGGQDFIISFEEYENLSQIDFNNDGEFNDADLQLFFNCDDLSFDSDFEDDSDSDELEFLSLDDVIDFLTNNFGNDLNELISELENSTFTGTDIDDFDVIGDTIVINDTIFSDFFNSISYFYNNKVIKSNIQKRELLDVLDLQGRRVPFIQNQPLIYIYSDGSAEKRMTLER